jgi:hypothetical protein
MGAARLQWQVFKLHVCARHCPAAGAGYQTAVTVMQWQDTKLHAWMRTAALLQWQNIKLNARVAALLQWQVLKLLNWVKDKQTCPNNNNNNNNARCKPLELCKLSRVKTAL